MPYVVFAKIHVSAKTRATCQSEILKLSLEGDYNKSAPSHLHIISEPNNFLKVERALNVANIKVDL